MVLGMAWGGDEDAAGPWRRRMPPWESRLGPRRRLGTAHAALPRFHRPLRPLHRKQKALFPRRPAPLSPRHQLRPAPRLSDGSGAMESVCAFCLLFLLGLKSCKWGAGEGGSGTSAKQHLWWGGERDVMPDARLSPGIRKAGGGGGTLGGLAVGWQGGGSAWPRGCECLWLPPTWEISRSGSTRVYLKWDCRGLFSPPPPALLVL